MRALFLVDAYFPSTLSSARLIHDLACATRDLGHQAIVVAPGGTDGKAAMVSDENGVTVLRFRAGRIKGASRPIRALNEARLSSNVWRAGREFFERHPCDIIAYYSPTIFFGALVARLKRLWGARSFLILRDIFPQWAVDAGVLRAGSLPHRYFLRKEREQYAAADVIGVQSPANLGYFEDRGWARDYRFDVLYNWMTLSSESVPRTEFRRRLGIEDRVIFFFGGNIGVAQAPDRMVDLAANLAPHPRAFVLLVGRGTEKERIAKRVKDEKLDNMAVLDAVDQTTYLGLLDEADVGLITLDRKLRTHNFPGKMLGYLHRSKPILASINPGNDLQELLVEHGAGIVCSDPDDRAFFEGATQLATDDGLRKRMGANGRRLLEQKFSAESAARQILGHARPS